jgi:hypothetical protein
LEQIGRLINVYHPSILFLPALWAGLELELAEAQSEGDTGADVGDHCRVMNLTRASSLTTGKRETGRFYYTVSVYMIDPDGNPYMVQ